MPDTNEGKKSMAKIYNLSYDFSEELVNKNKVSNDRRIDRDQFVDILCRDGIVSLQDAFVIEGEPEDQKHIVLKPVETTIMFYSDRTLEEINNYLSQYANQLYYIITQVADDAIKGYSHINYSHQDPCDDMTRKQAFEQLVANITRRVIFKLKKI